MKEYLSIERDVENEIVIEHSRFITYVKKVDTEEQAKEFIIAIKKKHSLATHNCYGYVVESGLIRRFSDDGEPSKTAGAPILDAIISNGLTNVAVVVTRYFGGIKLGAGGLVRAYSSSASLCLKKAGICRFVACNIFSVKTDYVNQKLYIGAIKESGAEVLNIDYSGVVTIEFSIEVDKTDNLNAVFKKWFKTEMKLIPIAEKYLKSSV